MSDLRLTTMQISVLWEGVLPYRWEREAWISTIHHGGDPTCRGRILVQDRPTGFPAVRFEISGNGLPWGGAWVKLGNKGISAIAITAFGELFRAGRLDAIATLTESAQNEQYRVTE